MCHAKKSEFRSNRRLHFRPPDVCWKALTFSVELFFFFIFTGPLLLAAAEIGRPSDLYQRVRSYIKPDYFLHLCPRPNFLRANDAKSGLNFWPTCLWATHVSKWSKALNLKQIWWALVTDICFPKLCTVRLTHPCEPSGVWPLKIEQWWFAQIINNSTAHSPVALKFDMLVHCGSPNRRLRNCEINFRSVKSKMADGPIISTFRSQ